MEDLTEGEQAWVLVGVLIGASFFVSLLLCFTSPSITPKRRLYTGMMLLATSVSSVFSFYDLLPLPLYIYLTATVFIYWMSFVKPGTRPLIFRIFISYPANLYQGICLIMVPVCWISWAYWKWFSLIPTAIIIAGFIQSFFLRKEYVYVSVNNNSPASNTLTRLPVTSKHTPIEGVENGGRKLRIAQITDPHVGVNMSPERLNNICKTIVEWSPDLVFVTGDIITVESYYEREKLLYAFEPLKALPGKVYGCLGNHDYESLPIVEMVLQDSGVNLLRDEDAIVNTPIGEIQIIGTEFIWERNKARKQEIINDILRKFPEKEHFRIWLVHNPGDFVYYPDGSVDIMLSGHTHGGQVGLQSFGINFSFFGLLTRSPDFGLWQKGQNLLYVHRGTGFQGFPVRLGVDGELSLVTITL